MSGNFLLASIVTAEKYAAGSSHDQGHVTLQEKDWLRCRFVHVNYLFNFSKLLYIHPLKKTTRADGESIHREETRYKNFKRKEQL